MNTKDLSSWLDLRRRQITFTCVFLLLAAAISNCKGKGKPASEVLRVEHQDTAPTKTQDLRTARVVSLNKWAEELLSSTRDGDDYQKMVDDYFKKNGITDAEPLKNYTLSLRTAKECFSDWKEDLRWSSNLNAVRLQLESAAEFIVEFHKAMNGKPYGPFAIREVELCPQSTTGAVLRLNGQKLTIGIPAAYLSAYAPLSSDRLLQMWHNGEQFADDRSLYEKFMKRPFFQKIWTIFDPIGHVRINLRTLIQIQGQRLAKDIKNFKKDFGKNPPAEKVASELVRANDANGARTSRLPDKGATLQNSLATIEQQGAMGTFLDNWLCATQDPELSDNLSQAALASLENATRQEHNNISIEINAGLVAVGNYHRIGVNLAVDAGSAQRFVDDIRQRERRTNLNARVYGGLVAVFTVDDISVDVAARILNEAAQGSAVTASLHRALNATLAKQSLCGAP